MTTTGNPSTIPCVRLSSSGHPCPSWSPPAWLAKFTEMPGASRRQDCLRNSSLAAVISTAGQPPTCATCWYRSASPPIGMGCPTCGFLHGHLVLDRRHEPGGAKLLPISLCCRFACQRASAPTTAAPAAARAKAVAAQQTPVALTSTTWTTADSPANGHHFQQRQHQRRRGRRQWRHIKRQYP